MQGFYANGGDLNSKPHAQARAIPTEPSPLPSLLIIFYLVFV